MRSEDQTRTADRPTPESAIRASQFTVAPLIVVSGPSGVGKTTVVDRLLAGFDRPVRRVITATTRAPRPDEADGRDYYFWSASTFEKALADGRMLEHAFVHGTDYYGTPRSEVDSHRAAGVGVIAVIDVQGAETVRRIYPGDHLSVFLVPPTFDDLAVRLRTRGEPEPGITKRLKTAQAEIGRAGEFDRVVVNADAAAAARVRAFFTTKPSEKKIEQVRQVGSFAVRILSTVLAADGELDADEADLITALAVSLGLPGDEERALLAEPPLAAAELEPPVDLDTKLARALIAGAWLAAANDGIDPREDRAMTTLATKLGVRAEDVESARTDARKAVDDQRDVGAAIIDAIRYLLVDEPDHALSLGKVAARLFLPRRHRLEPLSALHQRGTVTLASRYRLPRAGQDAVLAASWLAALHTDPSTARRVPLLLRHEDIARDLRSDGTGAAVREKLDRIVEGQLQLAVLAFGAST